MADSVLITDADSRAALAIVRALGKHSDVYVGSTSPIASAFYSRFIKGKMLYDIRSASNFAASINEYVERKHIDVLLPVGHTTSLYSSMLKDRIEASVPIADIESMQIARNKMEMMDRARDIGLNVPKLEDNPSRFPVVLKPISGHMNLRFVNNEKELAESKRFFVSNSISYFVTEYIEGEENYSFAGLFEKGKLGVFFMYREIREYPLTGGSATLAISSYDDNIKARCQKLLEDLNWHGVAMVEFKINPLGELYFMEVNPRFWASLDLAISCGVNFPLLLLKMAKGESLPAAKYAVGQVFRWFPEDFLNFISKPNKGFLKCFFQKTSINIRPDDIIPDFLRTSKELVYFRKMRKMQRTSRLGYPYGTPIVGSAS